MTVALCCDDPKSGGAITNQLAKFCDVTTEYFCNISDFIEKVSGCPDTVMLIAQTDKPIKAFFSDANHSKTVNYFFVYYD